MKRLFGLIALLCFALTLSAQNADSVRLMSAERQYFNLGKGAKGYQVAANIFGARRVITVVTFSPKRLNSAIAYPEYGGMTTREAGVKHNARFGINGGFPHSYERVNGQDFGPTDDWVLEFVDGLILIYDDRYDIVKSLDAPYYDSYSKQCDNILATGPILIYNGVKCDHSAKMSSDSKASKQIQNLYKRQHPRSVLGLDKRGNVYFIVVDGRHTGKAKGLSMDYLTEVCSWLGLHKAVNLDGGGSSTLWTKRYGVLNYPCDNKKFDHEGLRRVRNHLVVK